MSKDTNSPAITAPLHEREFTHLEAEAYFELAGTLEDAKRVRAAVLEWAKEHPRALGRLWLSDELQVPETIIRDRFHVWFTPEIQMWEISELERIIMGASGKHQVALHFGGSETV